MSRVSADRPDNHYDHITQAWRLLMGESFHYGYFESHDAPLEEATRALTQRMAALGDLRAEHRILDVGCGIGEPAMDLAERVRCQIHGISTSEVGIATARTRAAERGLGDQLSFDVRDGMANGFEDRSFDRVWVMESSHLMPDKASMIQESARVLRPAGRLVLCDIIMHRELGMKDVMRRAKAFDLLRVVFGRAKMSTLAAYQGWCSEAGLEMLGSEDISQQTAPTFANWKRNAQRHRDEVAALIGAGPLADFSQACDELERMWTERILGYGMLSAAKPS